MKRVIRINPEGFYVEDVILEDDQETPSDCTSILVPDLGLYSPKLVDDIWVEGKSQEEIDIIKNHVAPLNPTEIIIRDLTTQLNQAKERVTLAEGAITVLMDMSMM